MKLRNLNLTQQQISRHEVVHESEKTRHDEYVHPWYEFNKDNSKQAELIKPNPPSQAAVKKAKFVDKTYKWKPKTP